MVLHYELFSLEQWSITDSSYLKHLITLKNASSKFSITPGGRKNPATLDDSFCDAQLQQLSELRWARDG